MLTGLSNASDKTNLFTSEKDEKINSLMRSMIILIIDTEDLL